MIVIAVSAGDRQNDHHHHQRQGEQESAIGQGLLGSLLESGVRQCAGRCVRSVFALLDYVIDHQEGVEGVQVGKVDLLKSDLAQSSIAAEQLVELSCPRVIGRVNSHRPAYVLGGEPGRWHAGQRHNQMGVAADYGLAVLRYEGCHFRVREGHIRAGDELSDDVW